MKKRNLLLTLMSIVLCVCMAFGLTACVEEHTHAASSTWTTNATQHWKACSCGEKLEVGDHTFDNGTLVNAATSDADGTMKYTCTVCNYEKTDTVLSQNKLFNNFVDSVVNVKNGEGFNLVIKGEKLEIDGLGMEYISEVIENDADTWEEYVGNLSAILDAELFVGKDANGEISFKGNFKLNAEIKKAGEQAVFGTATMTAAIVLSDGKIYMAYDMLTVYPTLSEELQAANGADESGEMVVEIESLLEEVSSGGVSVISLITEQILPEISDFLSDEIAPLFARIWSDVEDVVVDAVMDALAQTFTIENNDGYVLTLDFNKYKELNKMFNEKKLNELYDAVYGEGSYAAMKAGVIGVVDLTIGDIIDYVFSGTLTVEKLVNEINAVIAIIYPTEEGQTAPTIDQLLAVNLEELLANEELRAMTIGDLILEVLPEEEIGVTTVEEFKLRLGEAFEAIEGVTFYEFIANMSGVIVDAGAVETIDDIIDVLDSIIDMKLAFDKDGAFLSSTTTLELEYADLEAIVEIINADASPLESSNVRVAVSDVNAKVVIELTLGEFANVTEFDYAAFIAGFEAA